jgi:hypothetical protein
MSTQLRTAPTVKSSDVSPAGFGYSMVPVKTIPGSQGTIFVIGVCCANAGVTANIITGKASAQSDNCRPFDIACTPYIKLLGQLPFLKTCFAAVLTQMGDSFRY